MRRARNVAGTRVDTLAECRGRRERTTNSKRCQRQRDTHAVDRGEL